MKIAILDFGMAKTHRRLNQRNFEVLSKISELYVINSAHYYDSLKGYDNVHLVDTDIVSYNEKHSRQGGGALSSVLGRKTMVHNMRENRKLFKEFKEVKFDYILIMGYEIITFALFRFYFPASIPTYIYQHQQIDELDSKIKNFFFNIFKNKVHHIVLEELFQHYLIQNQNIKAGRVSVVHFLNEKVHLNNADGDTNLILGVSSTNDEEWIKKIINMEKKDIFLKEEHWKMRLRSQGFVYKDNYLEVDNKFFSDTEYYKLFSKSAAILSLSPESYQNRLSGPVLDAIAAGKIVIARKTPLIQEYKKIAPSMFKVFNNVDELKALLSEKGWQINPNELNNMQHRHSEDGVLREYRQVFCGDLG